MLPSVLQRKTSDHIPVLADEVRRLLAVQPGETVVDATFGAGGHAALLAADLRGQGRYIAVDRDPDVQPYFESFKRRYGSLQPRLLRGEFSLVLEGLAANGVEADVVLLDLGVSSMQLDVPARGFSYATDAPLDMRMDPSGELTAADLVNEESERELANVFKRYGEERYARQIARAIVRRRPIESTSELVDVIKSAIPAPARFGDGHPAKRVFQALRIAVNDELGALERALPAALRDAASRRASRGDQLPLARGPHRQAVHARRASAAARARPTSPSACAATSRSCARCRGGRYGRRTTRSRTTRAPRRRSFAWR